MLNLLVTFIYINYFLFKTCLYHKTSFMNFHFWRKNIFFSVGENLMAFNTPPWSFINFSLLSFIQKKSSSLWVRVSSKGILQSKIHLPITATQWCIPQIKSFNWINVGDVYMQINISYPYSSLNILYESFCCCLSFWGHSCPLVWHNHVILWIKFQTFVWCQLDSDKKSTIKHGFK